MAGESWHLTNANAITQASSHQQRLQIFDAWDDSIAECVSRMYTSNKSLTIQWVLFELFQAVFPQQGLTERDFPQLEQKRFAARLRYAGFESKKVSGGRKRWVLTKERCDALSREFSPADSTERDRVGMGLRLGVPKVSALRRAAA